MTKPIVVRIYRNEQLIGVRQYTADQVVFGREGEVDVLLDDEQISPIHALIEKRDDNYFLCDLGSGTGTVKNGAPILDEKILSGDEIQIGPFKIEFYVGIPKPKGAPPKIEVPKNLGSSAPSAGPPTPNDIPEVPKKAPAKPTEKVTLKSLADKQKTPLGPSTYGGLETVSTGTFAPTGDGVPVREKIKPSKGSSVEVTVSWQDRVLNSYHFAGDQVIKFGPHPDNDIVVPVLPRALNSFPMVKIANLVSVYFTTEMTGRYVTGKGSWTFGELVAQGKAVPVGSAYQISLHAGEMVHIELDGGITIHVRYVEQLPAPIVAPLFDLTTSELTTILAAAVFVMVSALYFAVYSPDVEDKEEEEKQRKAVVVYKTRRPPDPPPEPVQIKETRGESPVENKEKKPTTAKVPLPKKKNPKIAEAAPNKSRSKKKKVTTPTRGKGKSKIIKKSNSVGKKSNANRSPAPKPVKVADTGLLSVFGRKGMQNNLSRTLKGSDQVGSISRSARGTGSGTNQNATQPGLADLGAGGDGTATVGIAGVKTKGLSDGGTGESGDGTLGGRKGVRIIPGGTGESFEGGWMDKEAIRRVVLANKKQIEACYEKELNRNPRLSGTIVLTWTIGAGGRVTQAGIKRTSMNNSTVERCVVSRLKTWKFPEPPPNMEGVVSYPFLFRAQN